MWGQPLRAEMFLAAAAVAVPSWHAWRNTTGFEWYAVAIVTRAAGVLRAVPPGLKNAPRAFAFGAVSRQHVYSGCHAFNKASPSYHTDPGLATFFRFF